MEVTFTKPKLKKGLKELLNYLENNNLSQEERLLVLNYMNKSLNTFPLEDIITITKQGGILANGKEMALEQLQSFKQSVDALGDNGAFKMIADQILFKAIAIGVHTGLNTDQIMFSKTAIWFIQQFKEYIDSLKRLA